MGGGLEMSVDRIVSVRYEPVGARMRNTEGALWIRREGIAWESSIRLENVRIIHPRPNIAHLHALCVLLWPKARPFCKVWGVEIVYGEEGCAECEDCAGVIE